jgi:aromatic-L-amino-acid/L-tryptophan decarboxylase
VSDGLGLSPEAMRALGHQAVDLLVDRLADPSIPALRRATPAEMAARLAGPPPDGPREFADVLAQLQADVLPFMSRCDHPRYFAFIPSCQTFPGAVGDFIASALNVYMGSWMEAAGPSQVELTVLDWFKSWLGYPATGSGILVSGASQANITALACAREALLGEMTAGAVAYVSDQAHSSLARAARLLGFGPDQLRVLPADDGLRLQPETLDRAIRADRAAGRTPLFASASGGSTNTGAVDPLDALADVCREHGVWLHVDAAYAGVSAVVPELRPLQAGVEWADSYTTDAHKWLLTGFDATLFWVADRAALTGALAILPEYLRNAATDAGTVVDYRDWQIELGRRFRALKLWFVLRWYGAEGLREHIRSGVALAQELAGWADADDRFDVATPHPLSLVCLRPRWSPEVDADVATMTLLERLNDGGEVFLTHTTVAGSTVLRVAVGTPTTTRRHVERLWTLLGEAHDWLANDFAEQLAERRASEQRAREEADRRAAEERAQAAAADEGLVAEAEAAEEAAGETGVALDPHGAGPLPGGPDGVATEQPATEATPNEATVTEDAATETTATEETPTEATASSVAD